jgi:3'-phosphoadenosine 5'-phosphosulfate sulfotransferase (PAPS reductase)/FAD synthetase
MPKEIVAIYFSCGAASAVAAYFGLQQFKDEFDVRIINNPIKQEHPDNRRFLEDVQNWLQWPIEIVYNPDYPTGSTTAVWNNRNYMSGVNGAPCTLELKKAARQKWEVGKNIKWHILGFTSEERDRHNNFVLSERSNLYPLLINLKMTKQNCADFLAQQGIKLPKIYEHGFPNANCIGCVKSSSPTYWNLVRREFPEVFEERAKQSLEIGCKLVRYRGQRMFLDELPETAIGNSLKTIRMPECGIFCEEKPIRRS